MRITSRLNELSTTTKVIAGAIAALVFVVVSVVLVTSLGSRQQQRGIDAISPVTQAPQQTIPPRTPEQAAAEDAQDFATGGGDDYDVIHGQGHSHDHAHDEDFEVGHGYANDEDFSGYIEPSKFSVAFPRVPGQMSDIDYKNANATMIDVMRARKTNVGREKYPSYFLSTRPDPVYIVNFSGDYANTTKVAGKPDLYRTIVVWHGTDNTGIVFKQVRVAVYSKRTPTGTYAPIRNSDIPADVSRSDPLITGESIMG